MGFSYNIAAGNKIPALSYQVLIDSDGLGMVFIVLIQEGEVAASINEYCAGLRQAELAHRFLWCFR